MFTYLVLNVYINQIQVYGFFKLCAKNRWQLNDKNEWNFARHVSNPCCRPLILGLANTYIKIRLQMETYTPKLQVELSIIKLTSQEVLIPRCPMYLDPWENPVVDLVSCATIELFKWWEASAPACSIYYLSLLIPNQIIRNYTFAYLFGNILS